MSAATPRGQKLRRAVQWVSDQLRDDPERPTTPLVNEAVLRYDLNPNESEYLLGFYRRGGPGHAVDGGEEARSGRDD